MNVILRSCAIAWQIGLAPIIRSFPGSGALHLLEQFIQSTERVPILVDCSIIEGEHLCGLPLGSRLPRRPKWLAEASEERANGRHVVVVFDEFDMLGSEWQATLLRMVCEKQCGETSLEGMWFVFIERSQTSIQGSVTLSPEHLGSFCVLTHEKEHFAAARRESIPAPNFVWIPEQWKPMSDPMQVASRVFLAKQNIVSVCELIPESSDAEACLLQGMAAF